MTKLLLFFDFILFVVISDMLLIYLMQHLQTFPYYTSMTHFEPTHLFEPTQTT